MLVNEIITSLGKLTEEERLLVRRALDMGGTKFSSSGGDSINFNLTPDEESVVSAMSSCLQRRGFSYSESILSNYFNRRPNYKRFKAFYDFVDNVSHETGVRRSNVVYFLFNIYLDDLAEVESKGYSLGLKFIVQNLPDIGRVVKKHFPEYSLGMLAIPMHQALSGGNKIVRTKQSGNTSVL